jgi:hypothetical protein
MAEQTSYPLGVPNVGERDQNDLGRPRDGRSGFGRGSTRPTRATLSVVNVAEPCRGEPVERNILLVRADDPLDVPFHPKRGFHRRLVESQCPPSLVSANKLRWSDIAAGLSRRRDPRAVE